MCVEHIECEPSVKLARVKGVPRATWQGIMTCGHVWTCPVCSQNIKSKRGERIAAAVRGLAGRWQMLTITLRHRQGMPLGPLMRALASAWRRCRQGGRIQRVWTERVTASVRGTEVTEGQNGWHPHLHVLLRTSEWDDDERDALLVRWKAAIRRELGELCVPSDERALWWSDPLDASDPTARALYLAKLGLEVAGIRKNARTRTPWDIARDAVSGDSRALMLWHEYHAATKGRRMLELDDRASDAARATIEAERIVERETGALGVKCPKCHAEPGWHCTEPGGDAVAGEPVMCSTHAEREGERTKTIVIEVKRDDVRALRRLEHRGWPGIFAAVLERAENEGADAARALVAYARERASRQSDSDAHPTAGP
jgi:hypothetical protein